MALLVPNIGELESLRYLLNATHEIPRNLILSFYTSNTILLKEMFLHRLLTMNHMLMVTPMVMVLLLTLDIHMQ